MAYEPRGKVGALVSAMRQEPSRIWTSPEVAKVMEVHQGALSAHLDPAIKHAVIFRKLESGRCQYALQPFPVVAAPAPTQHPVWTPPKMTAPRPGSDVRQPSRAAGAPTPTPSPAPTPAPTKPPPPAPSLAPSHVTQVEKPTAAEQLRQAATEIAALQSEEEPDAAPDAFISCRTGEIVLVGLEPDEEGRITIPAELARLIRRQTAWSPMP